MNTTRRTLLRLLAFVPFVGTAATVARGGKPPFEPGGGGGVKPVADGINPLSDWDDATYPRKLLMWCDYEQRFKWVRLNGNTIGR